MTILQYARPVIKGIVSCYPENIVDNLTISPVLSLKEAQKIVASTGIRERRFASKGVCASDMCVQAGENLLDGLNVDRDSIDVLVFLSQTPDYLGVPATSCLIQERLGLSEETAAFDMVLGCSGFVYALSTAYAYVEAGAKRVLLLVGETTSRFTSLEDKTTALLFGDAAAALLIEESDTESSSFFSLKTSGAGGQAIVIPSGGYRNPSTAENISIVEHEDGSRRGGLHVQMDGMQVFDFTMKEVVKNIKSIISHANETVDDVDHYILHQANKFMLDMFLKKLKQPAEKMPISIDRFGNTSTVSIPLTITDSIASGHGIDGKSIFCGYGAGLSWGSVFLNLSSLDYTDHQEYKK